LPFGVLEAGLSQRRHRHHLSLLQHLKQLRGTWPHHRVELETGFEDSNQGLRNALPFLFLDLHTQNLLLDPLVVPAAVEEVLLVDKVVDAATECPDVDLAVEVRNLHDHLRSRVVYVPTEVALFYQLLEVERHAYWVELDSASEVVEPAWVNVSVDNPHGVDVLQR